jgi:hypothetical protein
MLILDQLKEAVAANNDVDDESAINISYSDGTTDTITISGSSGLYDSQTVSSSASVCSPCYTYIGNCHTTGTTYTIGTGIPGLTIGSICNTNNTWTTGAGSGYSFTPSPNTVNITTDGISMEAGTDIKLGGKSLKEFMNKMEERLAILVPDPKKLEKFEALKKAYEHYKTMESLCFDEPEEEK